MDNLGDASAELFGILLTMSFPGMCVEPDRVQCRRPLLGCSPARSLNRNTANPGSLTLSLKVSFHNDESLTTRITLITADAEPGDRQRSTWRCLLSRHAPRSAFSPTVHRRSSHVGDLIMVDADIRTVASFCRTYDLRVPVLLAPMAGACPPPLSAGVINAGGFGACGALLMHPATITAWATEVKTASSDRFQVNLWVPDPAPQRDPAAEAATRQFLEQWGPPVPAEAGDACPPDFDEQCETMLGLRPRVMSSIMGLYPAAVVDRMKSQGIRWFATATTVGEAVAAERAGADVIVAQGMEAGGHRGAFDNATATQHLVGLFSLLPAIVDAVRVPVVAAGGIADGRGVAAAVLLGASAVQIGTAFLRTPEAGIANAWADAISGARPEDTTITRAYSGRAGRSITTAYTLAAAQTGSPPPAPYPVQRGLTQAMRDTGVRTNDIDRIQAWAGQSAALAQARPCAEIVTQLWASAEQLLTSNAATIRSRY